MNDLSSLRPTLFSAAQTVAQEAVGILSSINTSFDNKGVALGDTVKVPVAPAAAVASWTAQMAKPTGTDKTATSVDVQIQDFASTSWNLTAEQQRSLENGDSDREWIRQLVAQGMRAIRNTMEAEAAKVIYKNASRAYGTAGTTPFSTNIDVLAELRKAMIDNGAPMSDMNLVIDSAAGLNARKLSIIQQADQAGSDAERRTGNFLRQFGFAIKESAGIQYHTKGTGTGYDIIAAGEAIGQTVLSLEGGNSGTILAGDVGTFAGGATDANKYMIVSGGTATGAAAGTITIGNPGLLVAKVDADEMTIGNSYTANLAFERSAVVGIVRPPLWYPTADVDIMPISDEFGMTYLMVDTRGDQGMRTWQLIAGYGFKVVQSEYVFVLMG